MHKEILALAGGIPPRAVTAIGHHQEVEVFAGPDIPGGTGRRAPQSRRTGHHL